MTDDARRELRRGIERVVQALGGGVASTVAAVSGYDPEGGTRSESVVVTGIPLDASPPALTPAQLLGLAVLVGDPGVLEQALADYLIEQGYQYAADCLDRGRAAQREAYRQLLAGQSLTALQTVYNPFREYATVPPLVHTLSPPGSADGVVGDRD